MLRELQEPVAGCHGRGQTLVECDVHTFGLVVLVAVNEVKVELVVVLANRWQLVEIEGTKMDWICDDEENQVAGFEKLQFLLGACGQVNDLDDDVFEVSLQRVETYQALELVSNISRIQLTFIEHLKQLMR